MINPTAVLPLSAGEIVVECQSSNEIYAQPPSIAPIFPTQGQQLRRQQLVGTSDTHICRRWKGPVCAHRPWNSMALAASLMEGGFEAFKNAFWKSGCRYGCPPPRSIFLFFWAASWTREVSQSLDRHRNLIVIYVHPLMLRQALWQRLDLTCYILTDGLL